ncbi:hypothetical protein chiPu_0032079, partial [Chiloscyllium punctatum]|nr:hypothetical protein [Chiloscyllium punctatum]
RGGAGRGQAGPDAARGGEGRGEAGRSSIVRTRRLTQDGGCAATLPFSAGSGRRSPRATRLMLLLLEEEEELERKENDLMCLNRPPLPDQVEKTLCGIEMPPLTVM